MIRSSVAVPLDLIVCSRGNFHFCPFPFIARTEGDVPVGLSREQGFGTQRREKH